MRKAFLLFFIVLLANPTHLIAFDFSEIIRASIEGRAAAERDKRESELMELQAERMRLENKRLSRELKQKDSPPPVSVPPIPDVLYKYNDNNILIGFSFRDDTSPSGYTYAPLSTDEIEMIKSCYRKNLHFDEINTLSPEERLNLYAKYADDLKSDKVAPCTLQLEKEKIAQFNRDKALKHFNLFVKPKVLAVHPDFDDILMVTNKDGKRVSNEEYFQWAEKQRPALKLAAMDSNDPDDIIWAITEYKKFKSGGKQ